jgi:hypothetical protein
MLFEAKKDCISKKRQKKAEIPKKRTVNILIFLSLHKIMPVNNYDKGARNLLKKAKIVQIINSSLYFYQYYRFYFE